LSTGACGHHDLTSADAAREHANAIVDEEIAIVVDTVATFNRGLFRRARLRHAIDTRHNGRQARASATRGRSQILVRLTVAIVVEIVAYFRGRQNLAFAITPCSRDTRLQAGLAFTDADRGHAAGIARSGLAFDAAGTINAIVDFAVAVLIGTITGFLKRIARLARRNRSPDASFHHDLTSTLTACHARKAVVGLSVAIVVDSIAGLGAR